MGGAERKKLLILVPRFPYPPTQGDKIRAWAEVAFLSERYDVWLAAMCDAKPADDAMAEVRARCADVAIDVRSPLVRLSAGALSLLRGDSLTEGYFASGALRRAIAKWSADVRFDAALVFSSGMGVNLPRTFAGRVVIDMNDVDSRKWQHLSAARRGPRRWLYGLEASRLARWERRCAERADLNVMVNERECAALRELSPTAPCAVVRTGAPTVPSECPTDVPSDPVVGFVGSMSYAPNVEAVLWFASAVWPAIRRRRPDAVWLIVGRDPCRAVRRLASMEGVVVTGTVADVTPHLRRIRVMVLPHHSAIGVQTKLIEAMSHGKASVVTPEVAGGITTGGFTPFLIGGDARAFAEHVCTLLADDVAVRRTGRQAWACADAYYRADEQLERLDALLTGKLHARGVVERPALAEAAPA